MHAEAFRQHARQYVRQQLRQLLHWVQDPAPPEVAAESTTGPPRPNPVHELSPILSRLVESQERLIKEVREVTERTEPLDPSRDDSGGGTAVTYDWEPGRSSSPW